MTGLKRILLLICVLCVIVLSAVPCFGADTLKDLVEEAQDFSSLTAEDTISVGQGLWDAFLADPHSFADTLSDYDNAAVRSSINFMLMHLRMNHYRETEIHDTVRSMNIASLPEEQKQPVYIILFETERAEDLQVDSIQQFDYVSFFDKIRFLDGNYTERYKEQIRQVFTLSPEKFISELSLLSRDHWEKIASSLASAHHNDDKTWDSFQTTIFNMKETVAVADQRDVLDVVLSKCDQINYVPEPTDPPATTTPTVPSTPPTTQPVVPTTQTPVTAPTDDPTPQKGSDLIILFLLIAVGIFAAGMIFYNRKR